MLGHHRGPHRGHQQAGHGELLEAVLDTAGDSASHRPKQLNYGEDIETAIENICGALREEHPELAEQYPLRWLA